jgi:hypothetical protein
VFLPEHSAVRIGSHRSIVIQCRGMRHNCRIPEQCLIRMQPTAPSVVPEFEGFRRASFQLERGDRNARLLQA